MGFMLVVSVIYIFCNEELVRIFTRTGRGCRGCVSALVSYGYIFAWGGGIRPSTARATP
jgi:hypothetical protein